MKADIRLKWIMEIVWWIITAVVCIVVLYPLISVMNSYEFLITNVAFIVIFIIMTRHIFLLKYSLISNINWLKLVLIFLCIPIIAYLIQNINLFQTFVDNLNDDTWNDIFGEIGREKQNQLYSYMRTEMLLFGTGAVISSLGFAIRMIISIWRQKNKGTV